MDSAPPDHLEGLRGPRWGIRRGREHPPISQAAGRLSTVQLAPPWKSRGRPEWPLKRFVSPTYLRRTRTGECDQNSSLRFDLAMGIPDARSAAVTFNDS